MTQPPPVTPQTLADQLESLMASDNRDGQDPFYARVFRKTISYLRDTTNPFLPWYGGEHTQK